MTEPRTSASHRRDLVVLVVVASLVSRVARSVARSGRADVGIDSRFLLKLFQVDLAFCERLGIRFSDANCQDRPTSRPGRRFAADKALVSLQRSALTWKGICQARSAPAAKSSGSAGDLPARTVSGCNA